MYCYYNITPRQKTLCKHLRCTNSGKTNNIFIIVCSGGCITSSILICVPPTVCDGSNAARKTRACKKYYSHLALVLINSLNLPGNKSVYLNPLNRWFKDYFGELKYSPNLNCPRKRNAFQLITSLWLSCMYACVWQCVRNRLDLFKWINRFSPSVYLKFNFMESYCYVDMMGLWWIDYVEALVSTLQRQ